MPRDRRRAGNPREWLRRARSDLALAQVARGREGVLLEDLCFHAQQAAEKATKALLVARGVPFPKTHVIAELLTLAEDAGVSLADDIRQAARLTRFASQTRYPGAAEDVTADEHAEAVDVAARVVSWAEGLIGSSGMVPGAG
jgi:HEPN domain-containing protein